MKYPEDGNVNIRSLGKSDNKDVPDFFGIIKNVSILGSDSELTYTTDDKGLHLKSIVKDREFPVVVKIETK